MSSPKRKNSMQQDNKTSDKSSTDSIATSTLRRPKKKRQNYHDSQHDVELFHQLFLLSFTVVMLYMMSVNNIAMVLYEEAQLSETRSNQARARKPKERKSWSQEQDRFSDRMFYRLFRMSRGCFNLLCDKIKSAVGDYEFKSEVFLDGLKMAGHSTHESSMYNNLITYNGDYISGEMKVALTLRMLVGGAYLDMYLWMNISPDYCIEISRYVMKEWICRDDVIEINFYKNVLSNKQKMKTMRQDFAEKSYGLLSGCIGALDGWLVRINSPSIFSCKNPGKYCNRKGFFAINVQAIVDKQKRILWRFIGEKGSSHNSPVFHDSDLGNYILAISRELESEGVYLVGDSAYALRNYLMIPYNNTAPGTAEDTFNFYQSSCRIWVECAFGEIDRRWGIFLKRLEGHLRNHKCSVRV